MEANQRSPFRHRKPPIVHTNRQALTAMSTGGAFLIVLVMVAGAVVVSASPSLVPERVSLSLEQEINVLLPDLAEYQEQYGVDDATAAAELLEVQDLAALQERLEAVAPQEFGGLWIEHNPYRVVIAVTDYTSDLEAEVGAAALLQTPTIVTVKSSLQYLDSLIRVVSSQAGSHNSYVDIRQNAVVIEMLEGTRFEVPAQLDDDTPLVFKEALDLGGPASHGDIIGGMGLIDWYGCPSGFTIKDARVFPTFYGFFSAGHCGNELRYKGVLLPFHDQSWAGNRDVQYHSAATYHVKPRFIHNANQA
jgi:hypothetical protein